MDSEELTIEDLDLSPEVVESLRKMGVKRPTTVQQKAIPILMDNGSVIAKAPTGTGKTFAFSIPILEYLDMNDKSVQALILAPTRELALQITSEIRNLGRFIKGLKVASVIGGQSINVQAQHIKEKPQIVVATPGRLLDMIERKFVSIDNVYTLVLDEADEMLKMGFINDVRRIISMTPEDRQMALFSATMPREIMDITWQFMQGATEIDVMPKEEDHPDIAEFIVEAPEKDKATKIAEIIEREGYKKCIVFCNTKNQARKACDRLERFHLTCDQLHGDIGQGGRNRVMDAFRKGKFQVLIATDVVARGIDVDDVDAVFNFDIPEKNELYLHRIGRTARAGRSGSAYNMVAFMDQTRMEEIINYTKHEVKPYQE